MGEILFVTPNLKSDVLNIPLGSLLLGTILREKGIEAELVQFAQFGDPKDYDGFLKTGVEMIRSKNPKVISFYTRCDSYHITLRLAQLIKEQLPHTYVVLGGPQADITACQTVTAFDYVDFVCCGEGETTIVPLFSSLLEGKPALDTPGLVYKRDGEAVKNPRPTLLENLDVLPSVDYSFVQVLEKPKPTDTFPVDVGRGCPFGCTYCSTNTFWGRKYRLKSPERIVEDIRDIHDRFGFTSFAFEHDMFTMKRSQVVKTCQLLKELDFPIQWRCSARVDCIDEELIDTMVDAGMKTIFIGIETGSERMQKLINKNLKLDQVMPKLTYIQNKGIELIASFIYGFPEETREDVKMTLELMRRIMALRDVSVQAHLCTFLPGTQLTNQYFDQLSPMTTYSNITGQVAVAESMDMINAYPEVFLQFREYATELREELKYFSQFVRVYRRKFLVYEHLLDSFDGDVYEMYLAFARINSDDSDDLRRLLLTDRFPESVTEAPMHDLVKDVCRLWRMELSMKPGQSAADVFCFNPNQLSEVKELKELKRGMFILSVQSNPDGTVTRTVRGRA